MNICPPELIIHLFMNFTSLLKFLKELKRNNTKEWFDANRKQYELLRKDWLSFVQELITKSSAFDEGLTGLEAKQCVFRINRDIRFSSDKSPYKTNFGSSINRNGRNSAYAGYYIHIEPGNCFIAGGSYMPDAGRLAAIRQEIDYNLKEFTSILSDRSFKKQFGELGGDKLSRPPKGYEASNPAVEFLKHKSFLVVRNVPDSLLLDKNFSKDILQAFRAMKPLLDFLNRTVD
jgi:uncharacterized protein (TIGR02453 family)